MFTRQSESDELAGLCKNLLKSKLARNQKLLKSNYKMFSSQFAYFYYSVSKTSDETKMKKYYKNAVEREFKVGDEVLVLLLMNVHLLRAKFQGPYKVIRKVSKLKYILSAPDRRN